MFSLPGGVTVRVILLSIGMWLATMFLAASAERSHVLLKLSEGTPQPPALAGQLSDWRHSGVISDVLWLESDRQENPDFSLFIALEFPSETYLDNWEKTERAKLGAGLEVQRVDALVHGEKTPRDSNRSVFKVNTYGVTTSAEEYKKYSEGYIRPLMDAQIHDKVMMRYTMFLDHETGRQATLLMEYRDNVAFDKSEGLKEGIRANLMATNPTYASYNATKESLRQDGTETLASYRELPPPSLEFLPSYKPEFDVVGGFRIVGSELKNAVEQLAEGFNSFHPGAKMSVSHIPSSEGGIAGLYLGVSDLAPMGDDAKITDMMPFYNTYGYMPTEISVATGGYEKRGSLFAWAIVVNEDNPLEEISVDELKSIFGAQRTGGWKRYDHNYKFTSEFARDESENIRTWGELGLKGSWKKKKIDPFGYAAPGFATYFERNWFHWSKKWNSDFREYVEEKQTVGDAAGAAVASTVPLQDLQTNKYAIGIAGLMHVRNYPGLKVLRISEHKGGPAIALTPETVADRSYPLIRDAFFYVNMSPETGLDPKVREFMRFVLSREGQEIIARVGYYYPLDAETLEAERKKLD